MLSLGPGMHSRHGMMIALLAPLLALCPMHVGGQTPPATTAPATTLSPDQLPDDPSQELLPIAQPEPAPQTGVPVQLAAGTQTLVGNVWTGTGGVVVHYRDYILSADKVVYDRSTTDLEADGHVQVRGGPDDVLINADRGEMRLDVHTARYFKVTGTIGVHTGSHSVVYTTANPFFFTGRVLIQTGEGKYRIIDGAMTNCRLPRPDWQLISRSIDLDNNKASTTNSVFKFLGIPLFFLPYLRHPTDETGRESGFLIPVFPSNYSSVRGYTLGEEFYWAISRSMDMIIGSEYYSKRGFAPKGDFRYKGPGIDHLTVTWQSLLDRGFEEQVGATIPLPGNRPSVQRADRPAGPVGYEYVNQGGIDIGALGRKDLSDETYIAGNIEFLSNYVYRLVFDDNYSQAVSSEVASVAAITHAHNGFIPSLSLDRFQTFASATKGDEARILHLPSLRYDVLDRPLSALPLYWGLASSIDYLSRSEPLFHARNVGRIDFHPHISLPFDVAGWSIVPEGALRETFYTGSQDPDLSGIQGGTPSISHDSLNRADVEASVDIRPPAIERDFALGHWDRVLRHVIEPELTYRFVGGIGQQARDVLLIDTNDIVTDTNQLGFFINQRFYLRPNGDQPCTADATRTAASCPAKPREWASWQLGEEFFFDPNFGGALIPNRRNVIDSSLDLTAIAFLTGPRNLAPIISRVRFDAIDNLRVEWDLDFDPKTGRIESDNIFAGYSWGRTTMGVGHSMLNAVDETSGAASTLQSQQVQPFLSIGKQNGNGFNLAANGGYDFIQRTIQYAGVQAVYNWDCCGLTFGYRRFQLGTVGTTSRDETQWLYSFTLANFGSPGDIRRSNSVFRDPTLPPAY
jgi:LPS-assembly protein